MNISWYGEFNTCVDMHMYWSNEFEQLIDKYMYVYKKHVDIHEHVLRLRFRWISIACTNTPLCNCQPL